MIKISHSGNFDKTEKFLKGVTNSNYINILEKYGREGVEALSAATPVDSGETAKSWGYEIKQTRGGIKIYWTNSNIINDVPIAIIIQYGHVTSNGGYVQGRDYINPAIQPIFDKIADDVWKGVTR
jgi:hypothetical protein